MEIFNGIGLIIDCYRRFYKSSITMISIPFYRYQPLRQDSIIEAKDYIDYKLIGIMIEYQP